MKAPSEYDRVVEVRAGLSDERFGYDRWCAEQFSGRFTRPALLVIARPDENLRDLATRITVAARTDTTEGEK